jgi:hypothetical protein
MMMATVKIAPIRAQNRSTGSHADLPTRSALADADQHSSGGDGDGDAQPERHDGDDRNHTQDDCSDRTSPRTHQHEEQHGDDQGDGEGDRLGPDLQIAGVAVAGNHQKHVPNRRDNRDSEVARPWGQADFSWWTTWSSCPSSIGSFTVLPRLLTGQEHLRHRRIRNMVRALPE